MFLQQQLRCKSLHYIQKLFSVSMADDELSGSDTEASDDAIKVTLFNAAARAADHRAEATFHEMVASSSTRSSFATTEPADVTMPMKQQTKAKAKMPRASKPPWRRRRADDECDSTESEVIAVPSDTPSPIVGTADSPAPSFETADTPAPSAPSVETCSTPAPVVAAPSAGEFPCPLMLKLPIEWKDVRYIFDSKRKWRYDTKTSPMPMPHPNMEFRGYIENEDGSVAAFFTDRRRRGEPGMRMPKKRAGGVNKQYFDGLREQQTDEARAKFKREHAHLYVPRIQRKAVNDPEN